MRRLFGPCVPMSPRGWVGMGPLADNRSEFCCIVSTVFLCLAGARKMRGLQSHPWPSMPDVNSAGQVKNARCAQVYQLRHVRPVCWLVVLGTGAEQAHPALLQRCSPFFMRLPTGANGFFNSIQSICRMLCHSSGGVFEGPPPLETSANHATTAWANLSVPP